MSDVLVKERENRSRIVKVLASVHRDCSNITAHIPEYVLLNNKPSPLALRIILIYTRDSRKGRDGTMSQL